MEALQNFLAFILLFIMICIGSTLAGALVGWVVGWFFGRSILGFFAAFGIRSLEVWQIGAALGFIGSFFKTSVVNYYAPKNFQADPKDSNTKKPAY